MVTYQQINESLQICHYLMIDPWLFLGHRDEPAQVASMGSGISGVGEYRSCVDALFDNEAGFLHLAIV